MRRVVEDYWLPPDPDPHPADDVPTAYRIPATAKTYRKCTATVTRKKEAVYCGEPALVPWSERNAGKGRCKTHGGK